jgi:hypothetical protein
MAQDPLNYFPNFLWKAWRTIGLPDPTPLQYDFAAYLDDQGRVQQIPWRGRPRATSAPARS